MASTEPLTIEDLRTLNDACQARLRVLNPTCDAYRRYQRAAHKVSDMMSSLADAELRAELAAEGVDPGGDG